MEEKIITNPIKAIRAKCLDCSNGSSNEVTLCPVQRCSLYPFRSGRNPYRTKRQLSDEQKQKLREQLSGSAPNRNGNSDTQDQPV